MSGQGGGTEGIHSWLAALPPSPSSDPRPLCLVTLLSFSLVCLACLLCFQHSFPASLRWHVGCSLPRLSPCSCLATRRGTGALRAFQGVTQSLFRPRNGAKSRWIRSTKRKLVGSSNSTTHPYLANHATTSSRKDATGRPRHEESRQVTLLGPPPNRPPPSPGGPTAGRRRSPRPRVPCFLPQ